MKNILLKICQVIVLTLLILGVPRLAGLTADLFDYQSIDPDGSYAWISVHHIIQAIIFIVIIALSKRSSSLDYRIEWGNINFGWKYFTRFTLIFGIYTIAVFTLLILTDNVQPFNYPLTARNIFGQLSFQLLLSGPSEELIFRAFAITMFSSILKKRFLNGRVSAANLLAAVIFGIAHIGLSYIPLELYYDPLQIIYSIVLGLIYGDCFERTGGIYFPMIMHSMTNVIMVGATIILSLLLCLG